MWLLSSVSQLSSVQAAEFCLDCWVLFRLRVLFRLQSFVQTAEFYPDWWVLLNSSLFQFHGWHVRDLSACSIRLHRHLVVHQKVTVVKHMLSVVVLREFWQAHHSLCQEGLALCWLHCFVCSIRIWLCHGWYFGVQPADHNLWEISVTLTHAYNVLRFCVREASLNASVIPTHHLLHLVINTLVYKTPELRMTDFASYDL